MVTRVLCSQLDATNETSLSIYCSDIAPSLPFTQRRKCDFKTLVLLSWKAYIESITSIKFTLGNKLRVKEMTHLSER